MIIARIRIGDDSHDWFGGECEFPVMPPIGSTIEVIDKNSNMRELTVTNLIIEGVKVATKAELPNIFGTQSVTIVCAEF